MAGAVFLGTIISGLVTPQIPVSPCPEVFQYKSQTIPDDNTVAVTGLITIMTPPVDIILSLFVHMQLQATLPSKYVGLVELVNIPNVSVPLVYRVRFPLVKPLPTVRFISVNSIVICTGSQVKGPVVTDIRLEHSLWPLQSTNQTTEHSTISPIPPTHIPYSIDPGGECGRIISANPLVVGGRQLTRGEWPWLVAIFVLNSLGLEFHCSGTVITKMFVVTVGHCMRHEEAGILNPADVVIYLGKFNLHQWEEPNSIIKEVSKIHIHPEFDPNKYTADITLIQLKTLIEYNMFIQPACLWGQSPELELIVGHIGTVVGWGRDNLGNKMSPVPRVMKIPIVSTEECIESHNEFVFLTSSTTLCAGAKNGVGPCNGDSGGGLMLPVTENNVTRWQLRGLVSLSLLNTTTQSCDLSQYIVFTDTAKLLSWISFVVNITTQSL